MRKLVNAAAFGTVWLLCAHGPAIAQDWPSWAEEAFGRSGQGYGPPRRRWSWPDRPPRDVQEPPPARSKLGGDIRDGGARPNISPKAPPVVPFPYNYPVKSIVIDTGSKKLYYVLENNQAFEYGISVGREGFNWAGTEIISRKQAWPDWHPPAEMRERDPTLPEKMTGGVKNPLGAMALYLGDTLYRIHGTNDAKSIGRAESSGCFRMLNSAVMHLAALAEVGTTVTVVPSLAAEQQVSQHQQRAVQQASPIRAQEPTALQAQANQDGSKKSALGP